MSDENMADDINKAINSGGYVIVLEKAVDGDGGDGGDDGNDGNDGDGGD
ncbi:hypothetical protein [Ostreibacterium oceani]|nr:hypothetical protein [Ostreibacterium oceani]